MNVITRTIAVAAALLCFPAANAEVVDFNLTMTADVVGIPLPDPTTGVGSGTFDTATGIFSFSLTEDTDLSAVIPGGIITSVLEGNIQSGASPSGTYTTLSCTGSSTLCASSTQEIGVTQALGTLSPDPLIIDTALGATTVIDIDAGSTLRTYMLTAIPVPGAVWLAGSGLLALAGMRRRAC